MRAWGGPKRKISCYGGADPGCDSAGRGWLRNVFYAKGCVGSAKYSQPLHELEPHALELFFKYMVDISKPP